MGEAHWHEWVLMKVLLVRDQKLSNGSRPTEIKYKRCKQCGKVLW
jgi:hypothetical protein